jgi:hypothetical protein
MKRYVDRLSGEPATPHFVRPVRSSSPYRQLLRADRVLNRLNRLVSHRTSCDPAPPMYAGMSPLPSTSRPGVSPPRLRGRAPCDCSWRESDTLSSVRSAITAEAVMNHARWERITRLVPAGGENTRTGWSDAPRREEAPVHFTMVKRTLRFFCRHSASCCKQRGRSFP